MDFHVLDLLIYVIGLSIMVKLFKVNKDDGPDNYTLEFVLAVIMYTGFYIVFFVIQGYNWIDFWNKCNFNIQL